MRPSLGSGQTLPGLSSTSPSYPADIGVAPLEIKDQEGARWRSIGRPVPVREWRGDVAALGILFAVCGVVVGMGLSTLATPSCVHVAAALSAFRQVFLQPAGCVIAAEDISATLLATHMPEIVMVLNSNSLSSAAVHPFFPVLCARPRLGTPSFVRRCSKDPWSGSSRRVDSGVPALSCFRRRTEWRTK